MKNQEHCRLPFLNIFSHVQSYKGLKMGKCSKKWYRGLGKNQSKLIKSVTSYCGHLARVDLSMHYSSVNTCQNQVKLCTFKVKMTCNWQQHIFVCQSKIIGPMPFLMILQ